MENKPIVKTVSGGVFWDHTFDSFKVKVFTPSCDLPTDIINYCFETPYIIVFEEKDMTVDEEIAFAKSEGLDTNMMNYGGSVVFVYPTCEGGWKNAPSDIYVKLIAESRIGQYNENGYISVFNFFKKEWEGSFIRGAVHRPFIYGVGEAADYIALNCLKRFDGNFLWGPGEITPVLCAMRGASVLPDVQRSDMVVISSQNSKEFNDCLTGRIDHLFIDDDITFGERFNSVKLFRRILGGLEKQADLDELNMLVEPGFETVKTSSENNGDDRGTDTHRIGYVVYVNKEALASGQKLPTLMAFHGGGDSAMIIGNFSSGWDLVAHKYGFLLICVENHLNSTATETIELIEKLKAKYPIDPERIYGSGFSMGGIKSWDLHQEYPDYFAAVAPMSATTEPGMNVCFGPSPRLNDSVTLPVFYVGGQQSPLPELAMHNPRCLERLKYVFRTNDVKRSVDVVYDDKSTWEDPLWAVKGDKTIRLNSPEKEGRVMTLEAFESNDGNIYTIFGSINDQQHELHYHQCEYAYRFMSCFRRLADKSLVGGNKEEIFKALS